jgi:hypothetical protein
MLGIYESSTATGTSEDCNLSRYPLRNKIESNMAFPHESFLKNVKFSSLRLLDVPENVNELRRQLTYEIDPFVYDNIAYLYNNIRTLDVNAILVLLFCIICSHIGNQYLSIFM